MKNQNKKYPEGHFIGIGIALGFALGLPLSVALGNTSFVGTGLPIGLAIGIVLENKYQKEGRIRPLTENEKKKRRIGLIVGMSFLILGLIAFLVFLLK